MAATSALVCLNIKTRARSDNENVSEEGGAQKNDNTNNNNNNNNNNNHHHSSSGSSSAEEVSARLLIQTLIDNGIINANNRATIRIIDNCNVQRNNETKIILSADSLNKNTTSTTTTTTTAADLSDFKTLNLGSFIVRQQTPNKQQQQHSVDLHNVTQPQKELEPATKVVDTIKFTTASRNNNGLKILESQDTGTVVSKSNEIKQQQQQNSSRKFLIQNQNSGSNFIRICQQQHQQQQQQHQSGIVLENIGIVQSTAGNGSGNQGNILLPITSASNLIRLSDGSVVIPVHRLEAATAGGKKDAPDKQHHQHVFRIDGGSGQIKSEVELNGRQDESNGFNAIVFSSQGGNAAAGGSGGGSGSGSGGGSNQTSALMDSEPPPLLILPDVSHEEPQTKTTQNSDGEPIKLPENLESLPKAEHFPTQRHRWNTNEEIAAILISFERHSDWQSKEVKIRPKSGSMLLYSRKKVRYRRDGYCWKKRKDGKTTREDHMKLKVQGTECIYGCYVHSAILPTFHRRCYWLLQNPDIVLVHYLNVPYPDDNKLAVITPSLALWGDKKEWTKEELVSQLKPMCESSATSYASVYSEDEPDLNNELEISTAETVEAIVSQLMEKQRCARAAALNKQLECGCPDSTCADSKTCSHPMRRITAAKPTTHIKPETPSSLSSAENNNQVSSTTGTGSMLLSSSHHQQTSHHRVMTVSHHQQESPSMSLHHSHLQSTSHHSAIITNTQASNSQASVSSSPLVLSLSQIQGSTGLLILNSNSCSTSQAPSHNQGAVVTSFVCNPPTRNQRKDTKSIVLKQESMEMEVVNSCHLMSPTQHRISNTTAQAVSHRRSTSVNNNIRNSSAAADIPEKMDISNGNVLMSAGSYNHSFGSSNDNSSPKDRSPKQMETSSSSDMLIDVKPFGLSDNLSGKDSLSASQFFNETLDLSQEDIQQTLSANMPMTCGTPEPAHRERSGHHSRKVNTSETDVLVSGLNPMEFIDVGVSPTNDMDDDVFVNLDAFDMLGDFPELEVLENSNNGNNMIDLSDREQSNQSPQDKSKQCMLMEYREGTANITDYSPEWAYPEGGVKVLVTGPWYSTTSPYTVLFDSYPVPTTLVQSGVLRCYCPAHEVGLATLQVACEGFVISNSAMFEYKTPPRGDDTAQETSKETTSNANDNLLKFTLLQRLEAMDDRLQIKQEPDSGSDIAEGSRLFKQSNFEDRLVSFCQGLSTRAWREMNENEDTRVTWCSSHRNMTLLHLAASLGYSKLVCAMLHWRAENSSLLLETEVDALSQDGDGYTPLMWACARGHHETAVILYQWNYTALSVKNCHQETALDLAKHNSHTSLVEEVERLENTRKQSTSSVSELSTAGMELLLLATPLSLSSSQNDLNDVDKERGNEGEDTVSVASSTSQNVKDEGVFLRPGAVAKNETQQKYKVVSLYVNIPTLTDSSALSTSNSTSASTPAPSPTLSNSGSEHSYQNDTMTQQILSSQASNYHSNEVRSQQSPISSRLTKRQSIDSGIHLGGTTGVQTSDSLPSLRLSARNKTTTCGGRETPKLSRFDRSMSLPLNSPLSGTDSAYDSGMSDSMIHSPVRRMDFALCEVASGPRSESPIIDVELLSDDDIHAKATTVGEQDVRVLTLAEQIIAAMPDRIKNESEDMMLLLSSDSVEIMSLESPLLLDEPPSSSSSCCFDTNSEFNFDHNYRYYDVGTPSSSLSPASSSCLPSPSPSSFALPDSPSPPPTTADFCEFFHASSNNSLFFEKDFSNLTLSDREQRELYEAAKIIQKAYRSYKGRKKLEEQDKERAAAILIQNYYRRYKQYAYFKQMTHAAMVIQNGFRSYCEHKRFKKNQEAAVRIQNYYRNYREQGRGTVGDSTPPTGLKRTYSQRRQHQAARKIQQFMRQSKNKLQRERAEREKQEALFPKDVLQRSLSPDSLPSTEQNNIHRYPKEKDRDSPR